MLNIIKNTINRVFASGVDSDASAFITATGLSGTTQKSAITTLVKDLKSSGLWSKMKAVYPMVTDNYNLISYSEDFSNAFWAKYNLTLTANVTTAPNGTLTADSILETAVTNYHGFECNAFTLVNGSTYTQSIYVKPIGRRYIALTSQYGAGTFGAWFDTTNATVFSQDAGITAAIQDAGNGWYRLSITRTTSSTTGYMNVWLDDTTPTAGVYYTGNTYLGDITKGFYIWGAQVEQSSSVSTYQPILTTPSAFMASQMKYNLKDARDLDAAFRLTWSGGWTYSATGATPNGANGYIDTNLVGNTNISQGNFGFGIYSRTNSSTVGAYGINGALHIYPKFTDGNTYYRIFGGGSAVSGQTTLGLIYGFNDSTSTSYGWFNGVKKQTTPSSNYTIPSTNLMFAGNVTGTGGYDSRQLSFGFASLYLNDSEAQLLNQIIEKYQVALSRGVQAAQSFYYNSAYSNEANTYLYSTQITGTTQVSAINTLINGLKANNLWTKMKAVYPFVTDYRNILGYTEDFGDASWTKGNSTITINSTTSPTGTLTADSLVENTLNTTHLVSNTTGITTSADNYTLSVYAKKANRDWVYLNLYNGTTSLFAWFNLNTGAVGTVQSGLTAAIQDAGSGWYRLSVTRTLPSTSNCFIQYGSASADNTTTFVGNGLVAAYLWGAQLEIGTSASAYQSVLGVNNYATNVAAQMKFNLVNPQDTDAAFRLAFSGGWTYSTNGAQPNGTNGYADTKLNLLTNLPGYNNSFSVYFRQNLYGVYKIGALGSSFDQGMSAHLGWTNSSGTLYHDNLGRNTMANSAYGTFDAYHISSVTSTSSQKLYRNGVMKLSGAATVGLTQPSINFYFGAANNNGTAAYFDPKQIAFGTLSTSLTDDEAALLYQLVQEFQTTLSRQV